MKGQLQQLTVHARSLEGNFLKDPSTRPLPVYLPPSYATDTARRYPVACFLHGSMGDSHGWTNRSVFQPTVPDRIDALIADGKLPEMIALFPDGFTSLGGTQWVNSEGAGRYSDYLCDDLISFVDSTLRTQPNAKARMLLGKSSGGYGALATVKNRPDRFGHIAVHSADAYFEYVYLPDFPKAAGPLTTVGSVDAWYSDFRTRVAATKMRGDDFAVINMLAMASNYSPNPKAPLGLELPFALRTARIRDDIWSKWLEQDPIRFVPENVAPFKALSSLFIDCGSRDEYSLQYGARMLAEALPAAKYEEFDDGHRGTHYRYDRSLLYFAERLGT
ncbi:MAG: alpha/beta hydrolase [Myxococcaceae bacterium]